MKKSILVVFIIVLLDQLTKYIVVKQMELYESIKIIEDFFYITSHRNQGGAWSVLSGRMTLFYVITVVVVVLLVVYLKRNPKMDKVQRLGILLYIAGAIGNFIDRVRIQEVVDFLDFHIPIIDYNFPIFNVADMSLVIGVGLIIVSLIKEKLNERKV